MLRLLRSILALTFWHIEQQHRWPGLIASPQISHLLRGNWHQGQRSVFILLPLTDAVSADSPLLIALVWRQEILPAVMALNEFVAHAAVELCAGFTT